MTTLGFSSALELKAAFASELHRGRTHFSSFQIDFYAAKYKCRMLGSNFQLFKPILQWSQVVHNKFPFCLKFHT